jgi:hypothetical protein
MKEPPFGKSVFQHWPLYAALSILLLSVAAILSVSIRLNQGHLVYALDDPYIGMAIARNFARYGVWGVTRYGFSSCSSSPLWVLLLSLSSYLLGDHSHTPVVWAVLFALLSLLAAYMILTRYRVPAAVKFVALLSLILLLPLPTLVMTGMEPVLQILIALPVVFIAGRIISREVPATADKAWLLTLAPLVTGVRFEGMFLIVAIGVILLLQKRWVYAVAFCTLGFLPVAIYSAISMSKGAYFLPNSVLLKSTVPTFKSPAGFILSLCDAFIEHSRMELHVPALLIAVLVVYLAASAKGSGPWESRQVMGAIVLLVGIAHMEFMRPTLLFRYSAYLTALCVMFIAVQTPLILPGWPRRLSLSAWFAPSNLAAAGLMLALCFPLLMECGPLLGQAPQCAHNIFEQQFQMALFVRKNYQGSNVALNDIGIVDYLADIHLLDLWGLASQEVAQARRDHQYQGAEIAHFCQQAQIKIAIIYDVWFRGAVPPEWVRVGTWTIPNNLVAGDDTVTFYAVDPLEAPRLAQCLLDFSVELPPDVIQRGPYLSLTPF